MEYDGIGIPSFKNVTEQSFPQKIRQNKQNDDYANQVKLNIKESFDLPNQP